jgi:hypothetical protein
MPVHFFAKLRAVIAASSRGAFWPVIALTALVLGALNLQGRRAAVLAAENERLEAQRRVSAIVASQKEIADVLGRQLQWPAELKLLRESTGPGVVQKYHLVVAVDALQCNLLDPIADLIRDIRSHDLAGATTVVMSAPDQWTVESFARVQQVRTRVFFDRDGAFAHVNGIQLQPAALVVDSDGVVVNAVTSFGPGRDLWPAQRVELLGLVARTQATASRH